jgi:hypothetical protein
MLVDGCGYITVCCNLQDFLIFEIFDRLGRLDTVLLKTEAELALDSLTPCKHLCLASVSRDGRLLTQAVTRNSGNTNKQSSGCALIEVRFHFLFIYQNHTLITNGFESF